MKRVLVIALLAIGFALSASAQTLVLSKDFSQSGPATPSYGGWQVMNGRLYQTDAANPLAKINFAVPQSGIMQYQFNVRYQDGLSDSKGGFGIQLYVDKAFDGRSWGDGHSYLLWINYDEHPSYGGAGLRAQVYRSMSAVDMIIMPGYDIPLDVSNVLTTNTSLIVPVKIVVNSDTGDVKVYDPTRTDWVYTFNLGAAPGSGNYIALRTNSLSVSFGDLRVTKLQ